jgi:hypothetical protein
MLGKLLSFLKRVQNPDQEVRAPNSQLEPVVSDNLIVPDEVPSKVLNGYFQFSVFVLGSFILISIVNIIFSMFLSAQKVEQNKLITGLEKLSVVEKDLINLNRKISFYKNSISSRKLLSDKTAFILDGLDPGFTLNSSEVANDKFSISLTGKNVFLFTQLIMRYLQNGPVSEISINSANYNPAKQEFMVELSGVFK